MRNNRLPGPLLDVRSGAPLLRPMGAAPVSSVLFPRAPRGNPFACGPPSRVLRRSPAAPDREHGHHMSQRGATLARRTLGRAALLVFAVGASSPLTVLSAGLVAMYAATGVSGVPLAFLVVTVALLTL